VRAESRRSHSEPPPPCRVQRRAIMTTRWCRQGGRGEETSLVTPGRGEEW
jgi:hypothetical protein